VAKRIKDSKKIVSSYLQKEGYLLLSTKDYYEREDIIKTLCPEGHEYFTKWTNFRQNNRCKTCSINKKRKYSYDELKLKVEQEHCILLSESHEYSSLLSKIKIQCSCGNIHSLLFSEFLKGSRCKECGYKRTSNRNRKYSYEYVANFFKNNGCTLITLEYNSVKDKLK